jgi:hypothetical protein
MGQAIASSSLVSPAAAAEPNSEIAEKTLEATGDSVVNALEGAYGVNRGKRRKCPNTQLLLSRLISLLTSNQCDLPGGLYPGPCRNRMVVQYRS